MPSQDDPRATRKRRTKHRKGQASGRGKPARGKSDAKGALAAGDGQASQRTCIATRDKAPPSQLLRVIALPRDLAPWPQDSLDSDAPETFAFDWLQRAGGRGAWVTPSPEALDKALTRKAFTRALKRPLARPPLDAVLAHVREGLAQRFLQRLALARRAGVVAVGQALASTHVKEDLALLVILADDLSEAQHRKFASNTQRKRLPLATPPLSGAALGGSVGSEFASVLSVQAQPFADDLHTLSLHLHALRDAPARAS